MKESALGGIRLILAAGLMGAAMGCSSTVFPPPLPVKAVPVDPLATEATRTLLERLAGDYGSVTWSAQQDPAELAYLQQTTGRRPLIVAGDFMDYSPSRVDFGSLPANYTENMIALGRAGHVLTFSWHWNAPSHLRNTKAQPWWSGFYTRATTFDVEAALAHPDSAEYAMILRDIDAIAFELKKIAAAGLPVLWRPLHESEGGWFWWGARGPMPFKQLWRLLFQRLTDHHGIHNLIWVLTSEDPEWYPGDDVVDVVGVDAYPWNRAATLARRWGKLRARFDGRKLVALTEFGGVPDIERMRRAGVTWSWFMSWTGEHGPTSMAPDLVRRVYNSPSVVTLEEQADANRQARAKGD